MTVADNRWGETWVLVAAILASSMANIDGTALNVAALALQRDLQANATDLLWIINAYALILAALILLGGSLGDHYGRKRVLMIGISIFSLSSIVCGLAGSVGVLIAARAVQGVGGALMVPGSLSLVSAFFSPARRGTAIGTWATFSTLTTLIGPGLGGWLAGNHLWRMVFFINAPLAVVALWVLVRRVPESRAEHIPKQLDLVGAALITLGLGGIAFGFTEVPDLGWDDRRILLAFFGGIAALVIFIFVEARSDHPMVPLHLFKSRTFSGTNALTLFLYAALGGVSIFLILNLQKVQNYPESTSGLLVFTPIGILLTVMSRWAGGLVDRVGARLPLVIGPVIAGVGFFMFGLPGITGGEVDYWTTFFPALMVLGVGMGITVAPLTTAVMGSASADSTGTASGINNAVSRTAGVLAIAIMGALALFTFGSSLDTRTNDLPLSDTARAELHAEAQKLAAAEVPVDLPPALTDTLQTAIKLAYVDAFRLLTWIAAALAWLSALLAALLVDGRKV